MLHGFKIFNFRIIPGIFDLVIFIYFLFTLVYRRCVRITNLGMEKIVSSLITICLLLVIIALARPNTFDHLWNNHQSSHETTGQPAMQALTTPPLPLLDTAGVLTEGCIGGCAAPQKTPPKLYQSSDIDEIVTGTLYKEGGRLRTVYASRTSHGDSWGLEEYADGNGGPGNVGYDIGPGGAKPATCVRKPFDDGIPANWDMPSTPMQWYTAVGEDHYGSEGPTVYCGAGLKMTGVGDAQPYEN